MSWRYGLVKTWNQSFEEYEYAIHEIYDTEAMGAGWTVNPVTFHADSKEQMLEILGMAVADISRETQEEIEERR